MHHNLILDPCNWYACEVCYSLAKFKLTIYTQVYSRVAEQMSGHSRVSRECMYWFAYEVHYLRTMYYVTYKMHAWLPLNQASTNTPCSTHTLLLADIYRAWTTKVQTVQSLHLLQPVIFQYHAAFCTNSSNIMQLYTQTCN